MTSSTCLRRELAFTSRRLLIALRLNRKFTKLRTEDAADDSLPSALECLRLVENRTTEYLAVLTRYRLDLEKALQRRSELVALPMSPGDMNKSRLHSCGVRRPASRPSSALPGRKRLRR